MNDLTSWIRCVILIGSNNLHNAGVDMRLGEVVKEFELPAPNPVPEAIPEQVPAEPNPQKQPVAVPA